MAKVAKSTKEKKETPLMGQYNSIKGKYPDAILLFRVGDFYETFGADAITAAKTLGITLTKRHNGAASEIELAGFPHHSLDTYLPKLVKAGFRVAICDQLEEPQKGKKVVRRGVTELVTPGIALSDKLLDHKQNNFLASVHFASNNRLGIAFLDASTGEFFITEGDSDYIHKLLQSFSPAETIYQRNRKEDFKSLFGTGFYTYCLDEWIFTEDFASEKLLGHFKTASLKGFGVDDLALAQIAAGAILHYLGETEHQHLQHITKIARVDADKFVWLDRFTIRNLELLNASSPGGKSLLDVIDWTLSPMGSRLMKKWMLLPLKERTNIASRHSMVDYIIHHNDFEDELTKLVKSIGDMERLIAKVALARVNPRQVLQLKRALFAIEPLKELCLKASNPHLQKIGDLLNPCLAIRNKIDRYLMEDAPVMINKGNVINSGVSQDLDDLRAIQTDGKNYLLAMQKREVERTGITSLKIGFNNVFGYYLEVRNRFKEQVPEEWIRKQTLVSSERYITEELKEYEEKIFGAEGKILSLESNLFQELVNDLGEYINPIQLDASLVARLDCIYSFASVAQRLNYCKPIMNDGLVIDIREGRHPVIEQQMKLGESYVPNDILLDSEQQQVFIITGPNMSGKSALLRQCALIVLMAQIGSFVPASHAELGIVDKVFTRVGASDNISSGESTFMVEMNETASIMNNLSPRSLILLDEIGRGTSTYDGISIAWALAEYLHNHRSSKAKTLFATHYHELTELAQKFERIYNYSVATKEVGNKVVFLRKLIPEASQRSFGIHVARMAGMPLSIVERANEVLAELEKKGESVELGENLKRMPAAKAPQYQLSIFDAANDQLLEVRNALESLDLNSMTPIEALMKLNELRGML